MSISTDRIVKHTRKLPLHASFLLLQGQIFQIYDTHKLTIKMWIEPFMDAILLFEILVTLISSEFLVDTFEIHFRVVLPPILNTFSPVPF